MDYRWSSLMEMMDDALEMGKLEEALSHLDALIISASSPSDVPDFLRNHTLLEDVPTLHHLARLTFQEDDMYLLTKLIKILTDFGYNIDKTTQEMCPFQVTALVESIIQGNLILVECLLRQGARVDLRDPRGWTPCHWAVSEGKVKCLEKLVQFGGTSLLASTTPESQPIFHMAVEGGHPEMVSYLLRKSKELGVDVNETVVFYKQKRARGMLWGEKVTIVPLEIAISQKNIPILQLLLEHPETRKSGSSVQFCIERGDTEMALFLLDYVSPEQNYWTLQTLPPEEFQNPSRVESTKNLILECVRRGLHDVNCQFPSPEVSGPWNQNTLLHLACLYYEGQGMVIKALVEEAGADINCRSEGHSVLTPLHILLQRKKWKMAGYFIENGADLGVKGICNKNSRIPSTQTNERNWEIRDWDPESQWETKSWLNALELLINLGCTAGLPLLEQVLARPDVVWNGAMEFHLALGGSNLIYISKVLERCAKIISKEGLNWVTFRKEIEGPSETVPTLLYVLDILRKRTPLDVRGLANLIKLMASLGYDLNLSSEHSSRLISTEPLLNQILTIDFQRDSSNLLLRTILQVDHFRLSVPSNPVDYVLKYLNAQCSNFVSKSCWKNKPRPHPTVETVKLLITHGLDVSGMVIDSQFTYHFGFNVIFKMLYCAGAKISEEFFSSPKICHPNHPKTQGFLQEIAEVKQWKDEFDRKEGLSLMHISRVGVRKTLKCIGALKELDELPAGLKDYVLCKI